MEDAVTRTHAQQLVAAALYVGSRVVGVVLERLARHPNHVDLRAAGLAHTPDNAVRLQSLAARVCRQTLGEAPAAVVATPEGREGWRVQLVFADQRSPLRPYELADLQASWERAKTRAFGPAQPRATLADVRGREQDSERAVNDVRRAQERLLDAPSPESREAFAAALARAQVATGRLREALRSADPARAGQPLYHDALDLLVALRGDRHLTLVERDEAVGALVARAAGLAQGADLRVMLRPTQDREVWRAHLAFNFRDTPARSDRHVSPASVLARVLADGPSVAPLEVPAGRAAAAGKAHVSLALVQAVPTPQRPDITPRVPLDPPDVMRALDAPSRERG